MLDQELEQLQKLTKQLSEMHERLTVDQKGLLKEVNECKHRETLREAQHKKAIEKLRHLIHQLENTHHE